MPRAIWTGAIGFGLVTVPVKLYSALDRKTVRFHQLSGKTGVRVMQKRVDAQSGEEVPYEAIVKGYEIAPERYVVIAPGELDSLQPKKTKTIEIEDFVELSQIDPIFYEHPYYLAPGTGGAKPYKLLLEAMQQDGRVAIARFVMRSKEQLVAIRPMGGVLEMATMLFADEILPPERITEISELAEVNTTKRELDVARQLVDSLAADFNPDAYSDSYREEVLALIERKAQGEEIAVQPAPEEITEPAPDLMSALKASLDAVRAREETPATGAGKRRKPASQKPSAKKPGTGQPAAGKSAAKKPAAKKSAAKNSAAKKSAAQRAAAKR
jgi:DNA end-binding protein Ku